MPLRDFIRSALRSLERRTRALYLASRDPRVPKLAKILAVAVVAYALSPVDLIPDVIPILGWLDDLVVVPLGIALVVRLIPRDVWRECLDAAERRMEERLPRSRVAAIVVVAVWVVVLAVLGGLAWHRLRSR